MDRLIQKRNGEMSGQLAASRGAQQGVALLEALISILIFSVSILALVGLQAAMNRNAIDSKYRAEASYLASQLVGQLWADQPNLGKYAQTSSGCADADYARCTAWRAQVRALLPSGNADVTVNGSQVSITVKWNLQDQPQRKYDLSAVISN